MAENEREGILSELAAAGATTSDFYPMVRGRLTHIAGEAVGEGASSGREGVDWELNFTTTATPPADNKLVAGKWLAGPGEVSVDSELAKRLDIKLGDMLAFTIEGRSFGAKVTSLRSIKWDNMRPNFYMIFSGICWPPSQAPGLAATGCPRRGALPRWSLFAVILR